MSSILIKVEEKIINEALSKISLSGQEHREGPKVFGSEHPLWSITLDWRVDQFSASVLNGQINCQALVHGKGAHFSYTDKIDGTMTVKMSGNNLVVIMTSLKVTLYISPLGQRINILDFDIVDRLPAKEREIPLPLLEESPTIPLPMSNGGQIVLGIKNPQITLMPGIIELSADFDVIP